MHVDHLDADDQVEGPPGPVTVPSNVYACGGGRINSGSWVSELFPSSGGDGNNRLISPSLL